MQLDDEEDGPSLEDLGKTYAEMIGQDPYQSAPPPLSGVDDNETHQWVDELAEDAVPVTPGGILEAMLFVGRPDNAPLTSRRVASLMRGVSPREVDELVVQLNAQYEQDGAAYRIESRDGGYLLKLCSELEPVAHRSLRKTRGVQLSPAAVEVLALVAYQQPIQREEIDRRRGVNSGPLLRQLVRRQLLVWERQGKAVQYRTSPAFLQLLGLESIDQLPDAFS